MRRESSKGRGRSEGEREMGNGRLNEMGVVGRKAGGDGDDKTESKYLSVTDHHPVLPWTE